MSERKKGGGLDYTPQAFPGARAPDGPAPDLGDKLAKMGLLEGQEPTNQAADARPDVSSGRSRGAKKQGGLDYTPQAFPGARAPDGPAPDLQARLEKLGLAEQIDAPAARPDVRPHQNAAPVPPHRAESAVPRVQAPPAPAARREPVSAAEPQAYTPSSAAASADSSRRSAPPSPLPPSPRRTERVIAPEPAPHRVEHAERAASSPIPGTPQTQPAAPTPAARAAAASPQSPAATSTLPPVPKEAEPRPLPVATDSIVIPPNRDKKPVPKAAAPASRSIERLRALPEKEDRVRISLRLVPSVDNKLDDLAHLRGLDRNTAISVAIAQDWVACFGLQARQEVR